MFKGNNDLLKSLFYDYSIAFGFVLLLQWISTLKVRDYGLQRPTGTCSGIVTSTLLVSEGLDYPGMSLAKVSAVCIWCHLWSAPTSLVFMCNRLHFNQLDQNMLSWITL